LKDAIKKTGVLITMATIPPSVQPRRSVDAHGRVVPRTEEEQRQQIERALRALDELDNLGDDEEQRATFEALAKAIDEEPLSSRKRFRSCD
jgi:hypothetical protein